jgi:hypothetical protein
VLGFCEFAVQGVDIAVGRRCRLADRDDHGLCSGEALRQLGQAVLEWNSAQPGSMRDRCLWVTSLLQPRQCGVEEE